MVARLVYGNPSRTPGHGWRASREKTPFHWYEDCAPMGHRSGDARG